MSAARMWWDDVLVAVNELPIAAVRELAKGPLDDDTAPDPACRACAALAGIVTPLREWHGGEDGGHTFPALASARCMVIYAVAACLLAIEPGDEPNPVWTRLAVLAGPPDFGFDLENGNGALAELHRLAAENTRTLRGGAVSGSERNA